MRIYALIPEDIYDRENQYNVDRRIMAWLKRVRCIAFPWTAVGISSQHLKSGMTSSSVSSTYCPYN